MNYKYRVDNAEFIFSEEENKNIQAALQTGEKGMLRLRDGKIILNISFIRYIKETDEPTQEQTEKYQEQLKLPPEKREGYKSITGEISRPAVADTNWHKIGDDKDWKKCVKCGVSHFIPNKEICLGCVMRK